MAQIIPTELFDYVVFGATGDLTLRKLLPALYYRYRDGQMPDGARIIAAARSDLDDEGYRAMATEALNHYVSRPDLNPATLEKFLASIFYTKLDGASGEGWQSLVDVLAPHPERIRVFYMATSPDLFGSICKNIDSNGLVTPNSRVVLEKPIGHDLKSALAINEQIGATFSEAQTYRIDHYLGKETVQNLLALRFANSIFERLWNADMIDHVQITVAETVGVESRAGYYDKSGQLRDMVQNHLLQLVCLLAMESPVSMQADRVRDEKLKVLRALKPIAPYEIGHVTVRGQYAHGAIGSRSVESYTTDLGQPSTTETFVAIKAEIQSWRWAGVPFYLRTGKRLAQKVSEVVIQFRAVPFSIFKEDKSDFEPNRLVMRLQPDEGIRLEMMVKDPGPGGMRLRPTRLNISFEEAFNTRYPDAYERLLMDAVRGNQTLFMRRDEVEAAWKWVEPIIEAWSNTSEAPRLYPAGSWGPTSAIALIERDGRTWHEEFS
jgi:glucose-6-phosphate 1-dehydrogenase